MTTLELDVRPAETAPAVTARPVTLPRVIHSQWLSFHTLRSSWAVLGAAVLGMAAIGLVVAWNTRTLTPGVQGEDTVASATLQGFLLGQLLIGALGVLFVTGEYGTGMIRSTMAAVPKRVPVVLAKMTVFACVVVTTMVAASVAAFLVSQALIGRYRPGFSLADPGVLRVVLGTGVYLTLVGLLGGSIGWIVRNTPGALVTFFAVILVIPVLFGTLLGSLGQHIAQWLPSEAGGSFIQTLRGDVSLPPWAGLGVLVAWVVAATVLAAVTLKRKDA